MGRLLNLSFLLVDFTSKGVFSAFFNGWCKGKKGWEHERIFRIA